MGLVWALEHEALRACCIVFTVYLSIGRRLGKDLTLVAEKLQCTCSDGVLWATERLDVFYISRWIGVSRRLSIGVYG